MMSKSMDSFKESRWTLHKLEPAELVLKDQWWYNKVMYDNVGKKKKEEKKKCNDDIIAHQVIPCKMTNVT